MDYNLKRQSLKNSNTAIGLSLTNLFRPVSMSLKPTSHLLLLLFFSNLFLLLLHQRAFAQEETIFQKIKKETSLADQLPPLDTLIKIAVEFHPSIKVNDELVGSAQQRLSVENKMWLNWISPYGNYSYGNQAILTSGSTPSDLGRIANGYRVGINIGFPIGDIWARKNRKAFQQHELKATEQKREEVKLIISEYVVLAYNTMIYNYRMMSVRYDMMQKAKLDVQLAESDFKTNNMTAAAYTAIQQIYTGTISEYENARKDFLIAMQKLELLLGVKLHTLMK